jgi:hypothetical protein
MCCIVAANFLHSYQAIMYDKGSLTSLATEKPNRMLQQAENLLSVLKESLVCWTDNKLSACCLKSTFVLYTFV